MNALAERLVRLIETQGPLSIAEFMTIALHDPADGYYATRDPLGGKGDFVTAPEISQMFGELIGLWCIQVWNDQGRPAPLRLVELGPGRGTLLADLLRAASVVPQFLAQLDIVLVEASAALREAQAKSLRNVQAPIAWKDRFDEDGRSLLVVANEFFDALPLRQYVKTERGWCERLVTARDGRLQFALAPIAHHFRRNEDAPLGAVYETAPSALALAEEIGRNVEQWGGGALIIDYGYAEPGVGETLQAVRRHAYAELLAQPGTVDLSAHVDFSALAEAAMRGGAQVYGPVDQGRFLEALGIATRAARLAERNPDEVQSIMRAVTRLTAPDEMGKLFKVLAIMPRHAPRPPGF